MNELLLNEADPAENMTTLAPNVGPPRSAPVDRRDTGYVSLDQPAMSRLATPDEFRCSTRSQASPVSERFSGDKHSSFGTMPAPKNVTFRGVRRRSYENYLSSSDASDEGSIEANGDPGGHLGGGSSGGTKPHHKAPPLGATGDRLASWRRLSGGARAPPLQMAGSGPARWQGALPLDPPDFDYHGDWAKLPEEMDEVVESCRHRHCGGSAGGAMPHRRSSPSDEATNRQSN